MLWGLSAAETGRMFGVSRQAFAKWLTGGVPPARAAAMADLVAANDVLCRHLKPERIAAVVRRPAPGLGGRSLLEMANAGRLVGLVVAEGVVFSPRVPEQVARTREEIERSRWTHPERAAWESVLHALNEGDAPGLAEATLALGGQAAAAGHWWGSAQLCSWAFEIVGASGSGTTAVTAASAMATACRLVSDRKAAAWWTRVGRSVKLALQP